MPLVNNTVNLNLIFPKLNNIFKADSSIKLIFPKLIKIADTPTIFEVHHYRPDLNGFIYVDY